MPICDGPAGTSPPSNRRAPKTHTKRIKEPSQCWAFSYTIGRVLLDVEPRRKKDETDWINLIDQVIELALLP